MKILPYYTAPPDAVEWSVPQLACHNEVIEPGQTFQTWDYLSEIEVSLDCMIDAASLAKGVLGPDPDGTRTPDWLLAHTLVFLQVECPSTQYRQVVDCQVPLVGRQQRSLLLTIPAGVVANDLTLTAAVILRFPVPRTGPLVPSTAGNRLVLDEPHWRVTLEGKGASFPLSAFNFKGTGYPEGALWYLDMQAGRLRDPFMSVVRLLVNTGHPRSASLLSQSNEDDDLPEIVQFDVLATMFEAMATLPEDDLRSDFEEGTLGRILQEHADVYLGKDLADVAGGIAGDLPAFRAELQRAVGFLAGERQVE